MATIAKSSITLSSISDAYSVSLTPSSCVIHADYDGSNPTLDNAYAIVNVYCGDQKVAFQITTPMESTNGVTTSLTKVDDYTYKVAIASLSTSVTNGYIQFEAVVSSELTLTGKLTFTIERETTMLDWVLDWEGGKTKVGGTYVMTPKLFVGKKSDFVDYADGGTNAQSSIMSVPGLTGVYIGPDSDSTGIYGYKNSVEIFHLNNNGGMLGGWSINSNGICSKDGLLSILGEGTIKAIDKNNNTIWQVKSDGTAIFANGNVTFDADGSATYNGKITSAEGQIACWNFDNTALWCGAKTDTAQAYASSGITIGSAGLRGQHWYIDTNGDISFLDGKLQFQASTNNGTIVGWHLNSQRLSTSNAAIVSDNGGTGLYMSMASNIDLNTIEASSLANSISNNGGIYLTAESSSILFAAYNNDGGNIFKLRSNGESSIANWNIENDALFTKTKNISSNSFTSGSGAITLSNTGIRGYRWRLESDGAGALANDNIVWDADGNMTINATLSANNITSGTISTADIQNAAGTWFLKQDGSGSLANSNIVWDTNGNLTMTGVIKATGGTLSGDIVAEGCYLKDISVKGTIYADGGLLLGFYGVPHGISATIDEDCTVVMFGNAAANGTIEIEGAIEAQGRIICLVNHSEKPYTVHSSSGFYFGYGSEEHALGGQSSNLIYGGYYQCVKGYYSNAYVFNGNEWLLLASTYINI